MEGDEAFTVLSTFEGVDTEVSDSDGRVDVGRLSDLRGDRLDSVIGYLPFLRGEKFYPMYRHSTLISRTLLGRFLGVTFSPSIRMK